MRLASVAVGKEVAVPGERIVPEALADEGAQAVEALPHVDRGPVGVHGNLAGQADHGALKHVEQHGDVEPFDAPALRRDQHQRGRRRQWCRRDRDPPERPAGRTA